MEKRLRNFMVSMVSQADLLILIAVLLPPVALDQLGAVVEERTLATPYGTVGPLALRRLPHGQSVWLQPYTGSATHTDPRATIFAARELGVRQILNWDQGVALNPVLPRGQAGVMVDTIDFTRQPQTFAGAPPALPQTLGLRLPSVCPRLTEMLRQALPFTVDLICLGMDAPRRETPAEARLFRLWGADVISQNLIPEAALAQEVGICYAGLITVGDIAADRPDMSPQGEVRSSLGATLAALPHFISATTQPFTCDCAGLAAPLPL